MYFKGLGQEAPPLQSDHFIDMIPDGLTEEQAIEKGLITVDILEMEWKQIHLDIKWKTVEVGPNEPRHSAMYNQGEDYYKPMEMNEFMQAKELNALQYTPGMKLLKMKVKVVPVIKEVEMTWWKLLD